LSFSCKASSLAWRDSEGICDWGGSSFIRRRDKSKLEEISDWNSGSQLEV
jgi:hypothetical protein